MRILDLFCGAGGASTGYARAGFTPTGVDVDLPALRRYPFQGVAMDAMAALDGGIDLGPFHAIHASPPCQAYSIGTRAVDRSKHPDLLLPVLRRLQSWGRRTGGAWVVENVPGAPFPPDVWVVEVCGAHRRAHDPVGYKRRGPETLRLRRHRLFASNVALLAHPCGCDSTPIGGVYGGASGLPARRGGYTPPRSVQLELMGTGWMTLRQAQEAIPPDYTQWLGEQILGTIR